MTDFDLEAEARRLGLRGSVQLGFIAPTAAQTRELERIAAAIVRAWRDEVRNTVLPAYIDGIARRGGAVGAVFALEAAAIERALTATAERTAAAVAASQPQVAAFVTAVAAYHTERWIDEIRRATAVNVSPVISTADLRDLIDGAVRRNVSLIRRLDADLAATVERNVWDAWNENRSARVLERALRRDTAFAPARANLIAVDQTNKLAGEIDRLRFLQAGLETYRWVTRGDDRVRPSHRAKNGRIFRWDRPPADTGHPGNDIRCRCRAQAVLNGGGS